MDRGELLDTLRTAEVLLESVPVIERQAWLETALRAYEAARALGNQCGAGTPERRYWDRHARKWDAAYRALLAGGE